MYLLFEDSGKYVTGKQLADSQANYQVELSTGKRVKVKKANVLLQFATPSAEQLLSQSSQLAQEVDLDLSWQCAPEQEFSFIELALQYFGDQANVVQQAAMGMALFNAPHYFRRSGKGKFKKVTAEVLEKALAAIAKKQQILANIEQWAEQMCSGVCPVNIAEQAYKLLFKPDKNSAEYKAVLAATKKTAKSVLTLFTELGLINSPFEFHWQRFMFANFPTGWQLPTNLVVPQLQHDLVKAKVKAYSIDDASTDEIDDALSLQISADKVILGIHIATPSLAIDVDSQWDKLARQRMSTLYMPGYKITMLPKQIVQQYSLNEQSFRPALSIYLTLDQQFNVVATESKLEQVWIEQNIRLQQLTEIDNEQWFANPDKQDIAQVKLSVKELDTLYKIAKKQYAKRMQQRGKPDNNIYQDYSFSLDNLVNTLPTGQEKVSITVRPRGKPIDLIVAEAMILANQYWGKLLQEYSVPGIYRYQLSMQPGVRVKMGSKALPHAAMGVDCYAWSTSPLRRYVDLINQHQLIACINNGATAAIVAPFKPKDSSLLAVISHFETTYAVYNEFQKQIETFWSLRYIEQNNCYEQICSIIAPAANGSYLVRAQQLPLVFTVAGVPNLPLPIKGVVLKVKIDTINLFSLEIFASFSEIIQHATSSDIELLGDDEQELVPQASKITLEIDEDAHSESIVEQ